MFSAISEMTDPEELKLLVLSQPDIDNNNKEKYKAVYELLREWNRWQNMNNDLKIISVIHVFDNINYLVPIYQRNYAWSEIQIVQLIEDIESSIDGSNKNYFLGNLIVNQTDNNVYEVIDGQQRLTTLYLIEKYLGVVFAKEALRFEARGKSNRTLSYVSDNSNPVLIEELSSPEILNGFQIIDSYFKTQDIDKSRFVRKLERVFLIQVQVPQNIDLNHYFEIMNTRGEQLNFMKQLKLSCQKSLKTITTEILRY